MITEDQQNADLLNTPEVQAFDTQTGAISDLFPESSSSGGEQVPPGNVTAGAGASGGVGWPPELFGIFFAIAFRAVGEKYALTADEKDLLGRCGKNYWDTIQPPDKQSPLGALLGALTTVLIAKVGGAYLTKATSALLTTGSTTTAESVAELSSVASPEAENPSAWPNFSAA